jgi:Cytochrome P460
LSCAFSREILALHIEGDLSQAAADITSSHLATCEQCRRFLEQLRARQSLLKSLRRETVSPSECTAMRRQVMSIINDRRDRSGWALGMERAIRLGFRRRSYALAAFALVAIVSVSVLAQMRHRTRDTKPSLAVFEGKGTLLRPEGYRDWMVVGRSTGPHRSGVDDGAAGATRTATHRVYINPSGYREYARTGRFPEGTLMVWESENQGPETAERPHKESPALLASVKDSARFDGGWGFFDFTGLERTVTSKAQALPESSGCRACHRRDAETDHVFTQFYPVLRSARHGAHLAMPRGRLSVTELLALSRPSRFPGPPVVAHT